MTAFLALICVIDFVMLSFFIYSMAEQTKDRETKLGFIIFIAVLALNMCCALLKLGM